MPLISTWRRAVVAAVATALCGAALTTALPANAAPAPIAPDQGRLLLVGQSSKSAWDDMTSFTTAPDGGSVYYSVKNGDFVGATHRDYAAFLADQGKVVQIGVSWKDDPPIAGADGEGSRQSTLAIAQGRLDDRFVALDSFLTAHPKGRYLLRLDYEVSPFYHCTDASCSSYKNAFHHLAALIRAHASGVAVEFVFHPVRGAQEQMYPGADVDWIGASIFNHDLCMPLYAAGTTQYNGTPGTGFDVANNLCKGYYTAIVGGNANAVAASWPYDLNDLAMMSFAKAHGTPMIVSEASPQNFVAGVGTDGREPEALVGTWIDRLFSLTRYSGPVPNQTGTQDLSGVIKAVTYIDIDWRYGFDGATSGPTAGTVDDVWWANSRLSGFGAAKQKFCDGLVASGFTVRCQAGSIPTGAVSLRNVASNKCVDVSGGRTTVGTPVIQWDCLGAANQRFTMQPTDGGYYRLVAQHSGKVVEIQGTADGSRAVQVDASGSSAQQFRPVLVASGVYRFLARHTGKALDVPGCSSANGAQLQEWTDLANTCQQFRVG